MSERICQTPDCGHGPEDHTEWGKGPCEHWFRGPDGRGLRDRPHGPVLRCPCLAANYTSVTAGGES